MAKCNDRYFLEKTLELAKKAKGMTSPNPLVGAVIVKNDKIIGSGYHKKAGMPHAEIEALRNAKSSVKGATLYINLEPCFHYGRTPPCVDAIIKSGIKKVIVATKDPNPLVTGKSLRKLRINNIKVKTVDSCSKQSKKINEVFFMNMKKKRPFVAAKVAQSLDGKIATSSGKSKWITSSKARKFAKKLRDQYDCVLVGVNTVMKDNPTLDGVKKIPYKVVIDPKLRINKNCTLIKKYKKKLIIVTSDKNRKKLSMFPKEVKIILIKEKKGNLEIKDILKKLYALGITSIYVEGGSSTLGRFFKVRLVDKAYFFIAPKVLGGKEALASVGFEGFNSLTNCAYLKGKKVESIGGDLLIQGDIYYGKK
jgi:diaminohydroxyphosphoribosylaminopyrimidine deaminase/5-amino-6-(5-phosphoribosylamino)uracil reductase